jgi:signal transduction histidine kinase
VSGLRSFLFSVQTKLVLSMTGLIVIAILIAGGVFVARDRQESKERALNRVAATSPVVYEEAIDAIGRQDSEDAFYNILDAIARQQKVRILLVTADNLVLHDSEGKIQGMTLRVPESNNQDQARGFKAWESDDESPEQGLVFLAASSSRPFEGIRISGNDVQPFRIVIAVRADTIADAWRGVLPSLGLAALIAIPLASLLGVILARQVAYPVRRLTAASEAMARGDFSQRVQVDREDEVGRLARAFTSMAQRVGQRDQQMRGLLANVSHDLKTPMTSITGYAQALTDGTADSEDVRHIGQVIGDEAQHVNRLLADLLYLGEIDAGQVVTRRQDVALDEVVGRCIRRIEPAAAAKAIGMGADIEPVVVRNADPDKLERAITNVLDNAAKFTPPDGEISVVLRRENGARPPRVVCLVSNSGSSIDEEDLPRIFDRFFRADRARRAASGSGLGLTIARELVELNHGQIAAENDPAGGVVFTLSFPA